MTKEELLKKLKELSELDDEEIAHYSADHALLNFINDEEITKSFVEIKKWYS